MVSYGKISESKSGLFLMTLFPCNQWRKLVGYLDANPSPALRLNIDYLSELTKARSHYKLAAVSQCVQRGASCKGMATVRHCLEEIAAKLFVPNLKHDFV